MFNLNFTPLEKLLCILLPICVGLDATFTFLFSESKEDIIANEYNQAFVGVVSYGIPPSVIVTLSVFAALIGIVLFIIIIKGQKAANKQTYGAYNVGIFYAFLLCIYRPLAGLTWYFDSNEYTLAFMKVSTVMQTLFVMVVLLIILELLVNMNINKKEEEKDGSQTENAETSN